AGILRDNFLRNMSPQDFEDVVNVKMLGAWNLFKAAEKAGLRFFVCLSSGTAIQGNPGQSNYSAANRMMSQLMTHLNGSHDGILFKALQLPPIEGTGMAEDPEIKALMKRMNAAYVLVDEFVALFAREMAHGSREDVWVLLMRSLPDLPAVHLDDSEPAAGPEEILAGAVSFPHVDFPMIDSIAAVDLHEGTLKAKRVFSQDKDPWVVDHKPFKFLKFPLVSAIMALETFMEASRMLYPHLHVRSIRQARFQDIIECPPEMRRESEISCRRIESPGNEVVCEVGLSTREISPSGRALDRFSSNFTAQVVLTGPADLALENLSGFPVADADLDSRPMENPEVLKWYNDRTDMQGRYRLVKEMDGSGPTAVRGKIAYRRSEDFAAPLKSSYQYPPYLMEALMQVANFYIIMRDQSEERSMIPYEIGEMAFARCCGNGELITIEGRVRNQTEEGLTWDAQGLDESGRPVMYAKNMVMRWFTA
ncbi:KR domain-containing protein, partial [Thermodesulfobacteriota bacterium]